MAWLTTACSGTPPAPAAAPEPPPAPAAPAADSNAAAGFSRTLALHGVTFRISSPNRGSLNPLRIEPEGLAVDNSPMVQDVNGTVVGAEVADLDADGSPEIYVYVQSAGSGSYGSLVAYGANDLKALSGIYVPEISDDRKAAAGYMGHDRFAVVGDRLVRRFPIYRDTDANAQPTGGTRQVSYRLDAGEAGWLLRIDGITDAP